MGENHFETAPMALYGVVLLMAAIAYYILQNQIIKSQGENSLLAKAVGKDLKGKISPIVYVVSIILCWVNPWLAGAGYVLVALMWLIPEKGLKEQLMNK